LELFASLITTENPSLANRSAIAAPIPRDPPVTMATRLLLFI